MGRASIKSLTQLWKNHALSKFIKVKLLWTFVWPIVKYGTESWTLHKDNIRWIQAFKMFGYCRILKVSWIEHHTNKSILVELNTTHKLLQDIVRCKLRYFKLVPENCPPLFWKG